MADYWAVIPSAGSGSRFGAALPKQYQPVHGRAVLSWTLGCFLARDWISGIVVATPPGDNAFSGLPEAADARVHRVTGSDSRARSVANALVGVEQACREPRDTFVLVHDAARPCVSAAALERLRDEASDADGGLLALPVADTLKRAEAQRVAATVDREGLWRAQTPQMFPLHRLMSALRGAQLNGLEPTDDAQAMESAGARPRLVRGETTNLKLTYAEDLDVIARQLDQGASR